MFDVLPWGLLWSIYNTLREFFLGVGSIPSVPIPLALFCVWRFHVPPFGWPWSHVLCSGGWVCVWLLGLEWCLCGGLTHGCIGQGVLMSWVMTGQAISELWWAWSLGLLNMWIITRIPSNLIILHGKILVRWYLAVGSHLYALSQSPNAITRPVNVEESHRERNKIKKLCQYLYNLECSCLPSCLGSICMWIVLSLS